MKLLQKFYTETLVHIFWFAAKRLFVFSVVHVPSEEDSKWMKPSFHFYYQQRDMLGFARAVVEQEEQRCQEESIQNSPTSSGQ